MAARRAYPLLFALVLISLTFCALASAAQFTDISASTLNVPGCIGAAWGDYDGDGHPAPVPESAINGRVCSGTDIARGITHGGRSGGPRSWSPPTVVVRPAVSRGFSVALADRL